MGGWPVGYLHNAVEESNSGLPRTNPESSRVEDLNQGPPDFKSSALNHSTTLPRKFQESSAPPLTGSHAYDACIEIETHATLLMVKMDRGRVGPTTTSRNMTASLGLIPSLAALVYSVYLWYWTSMLWSIDTCQNKISANQCHVTISRASLELIQLLCFSEVDR